MFVARKPVSAPGEIRVPDVDEAFLVLDVPPLSRVEQEELLPAREVAQPRVGVPDVDVERGVGAWGAGGQG